MAFRGAGCAVEEMCCGAFVVRFARRRERPKRCTLGKRGCRAADLCRAYGGTGLGMRGGCMSVSAALDLA